jgi:hypothetical protein
MAESATIEELRRATNILENTEPYTDEYLSNLLDTLGFELAAAQLWTEKAASYAGLVDVTESGSSRRMSQLASNALKMAEAFNQSSSVVSGSFTVPIERP